MQNKILLRGEPMAENPVKPNTEAFTKAVFKKIDQQYAPKYVLKIKIDHSNLSKEHKQKCMAHPYNVMGWALTAFEKALVGKKNWKTDFLPFLLIKSAEKEGRYQQGYAILSSSRFFLDKIQSAVDHALEGLNGAIEMNVIKIDKTADLQIPSKTISYIDAEGNVKLQNVLSAKTILGLNINQS